MSQIGHVYFMHDPKPNEVKIGWSSHPARRLNAIRQQKGRKKVRIVACIEADRWAERVIQKDFHDFRIRGEWFKMDSSMVDFIRQNGVTKRELFIVIDRVKTSYTTKEKARASSIYRIENIDGLNCSSLDGCFWRETIDAARSFTRTSGTVPCAA